MLRSSPLDPRFPSLVALALSLVPAMAAAQTPAQLRTFEREALAEMKSASIPGAAIAIVRGDRIIFANGLGVANSATGARVTPDMLFQIGSVTKTFTAALAAALAADGKLALDRPVGEYLPGLAPRVGRATMRQLLSQTAGLNDEPADSGTRDEAALLEFVRSWRDDRAPLDTGVVFSYSNPGFALAGAVAAQAAGRSYADLMAERLFVPLGMRRTTFRPAAAMKWPRARGHRQPDDGALEVLRGYSDDTRFWPAGHMYSSANDLARFAIAFMNRGRLGGRQAIPASAIVEMSTPRTSVPNVFDDARYGFGLFLENYRGLRTAWHPGTMAGFSAMLRMVPDQRFAVIILTNRDGVRLDRIVDHALALVQPLPPVTPKQYAERAIGDAEASALVGTYANRWPMEVAHRDGRLWLKRFGTEAPLTRIGDERFTVPAPGGARTEELLLVPGANGRAYLHMYLWAFARQGGSAAPPAAADSDGVGFHNRRARATYAAKDWPAYRRHVARLAELRPGNLRVMLALASAEALAGDSAAALALLGRYAAMGLRYDAASDEDLASLRGLPGFTTVTRRLAANAARVMRADTAFVLADSLLVPEDIAWDPVGKTFYVSSLRGRKIVAVDARGRARDFIRAGAHGVGSVSALAVDARRRVLWATTALAEAQDPYVAADSARSALLALDLRTGRLIARYDAPADGRAHFLGDMTLDADGNAYVSDARSPAVYIARRGGTTLEKVLGDEVVFGPQSPAVSGDGRRLFVADYPRGIIVSAPDGRDARLLPHPDTLALVGIDGLAVHDTTLIAVQNGTTPMRVLRLQLDAAMERIVDWEVLAANDPVLGEPTHGVVADGAFFLIANSAGFKFDKGRLRDGETLPRPVILRFPLR